jgi:hypothetical protein
VFGDAGNATELWGVFVSLEDVVKVWKCWCMLVVIVCVPLFVAF